MNRRIRAPHLLALIMLVSYLLRLALLANEGQLRFPDERRYLRSIAAANLAFEGEIGGAMHRIVKYQSHPGFVAAAFVPALIHRIAYDLHPSSEQSWMDYWYSRFEDLRFSSLFFVLPSVLAIGMLYLISRRVGADENEALLGAFLFAACNTYFMYSQHFLPYDASMLIGLVSLWLSVRRCRSTFAYSMALGALTFLVFWVYNGYFIFSLMLALTYCLYLARSPLTILQRAFGFALGALLTFVPIAAYNQIVIDIDVISKLREFSGTITHGAYSEGIILPVLFFAHAEAGIAAVWVVGLALAIWRLKGNPITDFRHRVYLWITCLLFLYLTMILFSVILEMLVVYGRIARLLAPFLVMLTAWAFAPILKQYGRRVVAPFVAGICILALLNFLPIINTHHYRVLQRYAYANFEDVSFESTFGTEVDAYGFRGERVPDRRYKLVNAGVFYPISQYLGPPDGRVIVELPHPQNNKAWHFDGMSAQTRAVFDQNDIKIWFVDTQG